MERPPIHFDWWTNYMHEHNNGLLKAVLNNNKLPDIIYKADFMAWAVKEYIRYGKQTFCVGPRLQQMFRDTDCDRVPMNFFNLPYHCFFVSLPNCPLKLYGGKRTGWHQVNGLYVCQPREAPNAIAFFAWGRTNEKSIDEGDDATFHFDFFLDRIPRTEVNGVSLCDFSASAESLFSRPIDSYLELPSTAFLSHGRIISDEEKKNIVEIMRIAIGLVLYLNSLEPETKTTPSKRDAVEQELERLRARTHKPKVIRRAERHVASLSRVPITWIGQSYEQHPLGIGQHAGGTWLTRRGHMHHFWTGPRRDESGIKRLGDKLVLRWVAPVYRDAEAIAKSVGRQYRFVEEKQEWETREEKIG